MLREGTRRRRTDHRRESKIIRIRRVTVTVTDQGQHARGNRRPSARLNGMTVVHRFDNVAPTPEIRHTRVTGLTVVKDAISGQASSGHRDLPTISENGYHHRAFRDGEQVPVERQPLEPNGYARSATRNPTRRRTSVSAFEGKEPRIRQTHRPGRLYTDIRSTP